MPPFLLLLKQAWERRELILVVALVGLLAMAKRQHETITALRARPAVKFRDRIVEKRVVVKGPVRIVKEVVKAPDGTETTRTTTDRAVETVNVDKDSEKERVEVPPQVPDAPLPYRYIGVALTPLDWKHPRASAGFAIGRHLDLGVYWDTARRFNDGAVGAEARGRF
jgi:hypothetical protein